MESHFFENIVPQQEWFSAKEVGKIIGKTDQFVRDSFVNQKILGHCSNGRSLPSKEKHRSYRISREAILIYLLETANYTPSDFIEKIFNIIKDKPNSLLIDLYRKIENLIRR